MPKKTTDAKLRCASEALLALVECEDFSDTVHKFAGFNRDAAYERDGHEQNVAPILRHPPTADDLLATAHFFSVMITEDDWRGE